jgi:hypothetical protein
MKLIDCRQSQEQVKGWDCPVISSMHEVPGVHYKSFVMSSPYTSPYTTHLVFLLEDVSCGEVLVGHDG